MILRKLSIINYRNIAEATLDLSPKINCLIGSNGMGKTNVLDAIYYMSFCKSLSGAPDVANVRHDADFFVLEGLYEDGDRDREEHIYCGMKRGQRKHVKRNGKEYTALSQHIGLLPLVIISPSDTAIIDSGGESHRRMMDMVIAQLRPGYIAALTRYNTALQQRNAALKAEEPNTDLIAIYEEALAADGEKIYRMRDEFVQELLPDFTRMYADISGGHEEVSLRYVSHCQRGPLLDVIRAGRDKDLILGYTSHGVHRDSLEMLIGGYPLRREGSQGQNKTFVIALKLAQFETLRRTATATTPLLLLDDIFDKLDARRVERIVSLVASPRFGQIFITDTNRDHLDQILSLAHLEHRTFHVSEGEINE